MDMNRLKEFKYLIKQYTRSELTSDEFKTECIEYLGLFIDMIEEITDMNDELCRFRQLEERGKIIPLLAWDYVYVNEGVSCKVERVEIIDSLDGDGDKFTYHARPNRIYEPFEFGIRDIGRTVFLTRQEALSDYKSWADKDDWAHQYMNGHFGALPNISSTPGQCIIDYWSRQESLNRREQEG